LRLEGIADTCFLVDWVHYRNRDKLFELFDRIFITEGVLKEIGHEPTISWVSSKLAEGKIALLTESPSVSSEAYTLMSLSRGEPRMRDLDYPEAVCLVLGKMLRAIVLTENRAAVMAPFFLEPYSGVIVWRSLEVLREFILRGYIVLEHKTEESIRRVFEEYMSDTRHLFSTTELNSVVRAILKCVRRR